MKDNGTVDFLGDYIEPLLSPNFYSLDQQEWEHGILWDSPPLQSSKLVEADDALMEQDDEEDMDISIDKEESKAEEVTFGDIIKKLKKNSLQNSDFLDGSWVDKIVWEGGEDDPIAKLIFNLQDDQMFFEIMDAKEGRHLQTHATTL
ncbi:hypothetical protein SUGI_0742060 [Cryptomeria japonica]|nr:hypothetical protein SUGI_0742060 [Cryptomeria japonica]